VIARIVVPTWNAGPSLGELLRRLRAQRPAELRREIVVIDSGSTDGSAELAAREGARVLRIEHARFNHGETRNEGARGEGADAIVFVVQDALPIGDDFLARLLEPFDEPDVAGAYARVVPRDGATALVRRDVARDLVAGRARLRKRIADRAEYERRSAAERRVLCHFNNVASAIRASVLGAIPFRALSFGEDVDWGKRALEAGHTLAYAPDAVVAHSHESGWLRYYRRHRDDATLERELFGLRKPRSFAGALARAARTTWLDVTQAPRAFAPGLRLAQALGRWVGASGRSGNGRV